MWWTSGGNSPERLSGAAIDSPSRIASRAWSMTSARRTLPTTFFTMSIAVSSGTPLLRSVESVRAKRPMAMIRTRRPKIGTVRTKRCQRNLPVGVRFQRRNHQIAPAASARIAHHHWVTKVVNAMRTRVIQGRVALVSSKIFMTRGITTVKRIPRTADPITIIAAGYAMVPMIFERRRAWLWVKSASRTRTISSAPECSPARIMFTKRSPNTRGCWARASASDEPSLTRCFTSPRTRFSFSLSTCSTSAVSASTSGIPACTSTASWRVMIARSSAETRPSTQRRTFTSRACWAFTCCSPSTSVRKTPSRRSVARRVLGESASRSPCTAFPAAFSALYSKTGMA